MDIQFNSKLFWNPQIQKVITETATLLKALYSMMPSPSLSSETKTFIYTLIIRLVLTYVIELCGNTCKTHKIESKQYCFVRFVAWFIRNTQLRRHEKSNFQGVYYFGTKGTHSTHTTMRKSNPSGSHSICHRHQPQLAKHPPRGRPLTHTITATIQLPKMYHQRFIKIGLIKTCLSMSKTFFSIVIKVEKVFKLLLKLS